MANLLGWYDLPEELVDLFANHSSNIDIIRIGSICKPWRLAVATKKRFPNRFQVHLPRFKTYKTLVSPYTFFRVSLPSSSCPNKGWLIKTKQDSESGKYRLLSPLSGRLIKPSDITLDLMKIGVSEICQSNKVDYFSEEFDMFGFVEENYRGNSDRVVVLNNLCFVLYYNEIWCCKIEGESKRWTRIINDEVKDFLDITLHKGQIYALDLKGAIWWISLSGELGIYQYGPSTPYCDFYDCKDKRLVEYCGDLCVIHCFHKEISLFNERTIGFRVYKMNKDLVDWVEVNSLGDKSIIVTRDSCFTVLASDYYGCLENVIYFNDGKDDNVFKLDDGCIVTKQIDSSSSTSPPSCFQMFSASFLFESI